MKRSGTLRGSCRENSIPNFGRRAVEAYCPELAAETAQKGTSLEVGLFMRFCHLGFAAP
jgi:hypothetical protein